MADVSGDRPWYEELAPDLEGDAGRGVEGSRVDSRRRVMAVWRGFEDSRAGVWLAEHTGLLAALSREGSVLVRRLAVGVLLVAMAFTLLLFAAAGGDPVAGGLLSMPFWMAALAVCAVLWAFWDAYRDSGERLVDRLSSAPGMATRRQVAAACGVREVMRTMVPSVLPAMLAAAMRERRMGGDPVWPRPWQAAMYVGECHHVGVWLSLEMHAYVLGPTRSGKTVTVVIPAVVEAPGFVLATSTRSDIISATRRLREGGVADPSNGARYGGRGRVHIFDPEGLGAADPLTRHNMRWTPLQGCEDPTTAMRRAQTLVGVGGLGQGSNNREWGVSAGGYIQALLYAAAISNLPISKCYEWSVSPRKALEAADLIREHTGEREMLRWADTIRGLETMDTRQRSSEWFGVRNAFAILADPKVRSTMDFSPRDPRLIDPRRMVEDHDTVYVLSRPKSQAGGGVNAGLFAVLLLDTFQEACQDLALSREASGPNLRKIEPPARFVLDELSNIETWGGLRNAITQGGGNGYQLLVVEQSRDMMVRDYDRETEQTVWNNCNRIMLGGVTDRDSLEWWGMQIGRHEVTRFESTWNPGQGPLGGVTERRGAEETVLPWELSRLPRGWMVVQPVREAPALVRAPHFMERGWWHDAEGDR